MKVRPFVLTVVFTLFLFFIPIIVFAQNSSTPSASVRVEHIANIIERFTEKITMAFKFSAKDKANYYKYLTEKRVAEISYAIKSDDIDSVEETASRYSTTLGQFSEYVLANHLLNMKEEILYMYKNHTEVLKALQTRFEFESGWWLAIQHDINTIKIFSDKLNDLK